MREEGAGYEAREGRPRPSPMSHGSPGCSAAGTLSVECSGVTGCIIGGLGGAERLLVHQLPESTGRTCQEEGSSRPRAWQAQPPPQTHSEVQ